MSITGAVSELNKEIERLTKIRDSLLHGAGAATQPAVSQPIAPQKRKYVRTAKTTAKSAVPAKKSTTAKKSSAVKTAGASKKRVVSAATKKKMSDAAKARFAAKTEAAK
jgi:DNA-binding protein HU-beta